MSEHLGEEFIKIRPDLSTFRAEVESQVASALTGVQRQVQAVQAETSRSIGQIRPSGIVLPPGVRNVAAQQKNAAAAAAAATTQQGNAAKASSRQLALLSENTSKAVQTTKTLQREILGAESAAGRYTRGLVAATAASTGFFRAVSFASGAFLIGATIGATIASAVGEFQQMTQVAAQTSRLIQATGGAANVTARQVDELAKRTLDLTGVDDELVKQSANVLLTFRAIRNEAGANNDIFNRAVKATLDISSVFRTDLRGSAVQLGKALQDPVRGVTALRRSGISLTQSQRALIKEMVESGRILQAQRLILGEVERQVGGTAEAIGRTLPGRLRIAREEAVNSLGEMVKRLSESEQAARLTSDAIGGVAAAFGAARAVIRTVGPSLADVAEGLGRTTEAVGGAGVVLGAIVAYKGLGVAVRGAATARGIYAAASAGAARAEATAAQATLVAAEANVTEALAAGEATRALERKAAAALVDARAAQTQAVAETAAARAAQAQIAAVTALSAVFAVGAAASGQWVLALTAGGFALAGIVTKAIAARAALLAAGEAVTAMGVASAALGGVVGIAALAAGGLALAGLAIFRHWRNVPSALERSKKALDELNESLDRNLRLRAAVGNARERLGVARFDEQAARRNLERQQQLQETSPAAPGSVEARFRAQEVVKAERDLVRAHRAVVAAQVEVDVAEGRARRNQQQRPAEINRITASLQQQIRAIRETARAQTEQQATQLRQHGFELGATDLNNATKALNAQQRAGARTAEQIRALTVHFIRLRQNSTGATRAAAGAILTLLTTLNRIPTQRELHVIVDLTQRGVKVNDVVKVLDSLRNLPPAKQEIIIDLIQRGANLDAILTKLRQMGALNKSDSEERVRAGRAEAVINEALAVQRANLLGILKAERTKLAAINEERTKRREVLATAKLELQAAQDAVASAREGRAAAIEGLASAQRGLSDAQEALSETIRQSHESIAQAVDASRQAVNEAIQSAKGNLQDLGQTIAEALGRFAESGATVTTKLGERAKQLRAQILAGGGSFKTQRAAQELAFRIQAETPTVDTDKIKQQFTDLVGAFERGKITLPQFNKRFNDLLKGVNIQKFRKQFGSEAAAQLREEIATFRKQAGLIAKSPQRAGGAIAQQLINPLKAVAQGHKDIANATRQAARDIARGERDVGDAARAVTKAEQEVVKSNRQIAATERRLRQAEHKERVANTAAVRQNAKFTKQLADVMKARKNLEEAPKPKPKGTAGKSTQDLTGAGARNP